MDYFLSCDWGSSVFRLRLVNIKGLNFDSIDSDEKGIVTVFESWKQSRQDESARFFFYRNVIGEFIQALEYRLGNSLNGVPLVISGMASSSIGIVELPYQLIPFKVNGSDLEIMKIESTKDFDHDILIVSGVRTDDDMMRGEETQIIGCSHSNKGKRVFVMPGTHSKHILVKDQRGVKLQTFMTGEFFELLSHKSILKHSVQRENDFFGKGNRKAFLEGVKEAEKGNLLHSAFLTRANDLLNKINKENNYYFLSGLLIGAELSMILKKKFIPVTCIASGEKATLYAAAFKILFPRSKRGDFRIADPTISVIKGQLKIWKRTKNDSLAKK